MQLYQYNWIDAVKQLLAKYQIDPAKIIFELTETAIVSDSPAACGNFAAASISVPKRISKDAVQQAIANDQNSRLEECTEAFMVLRGSFSEPVTASQLAAYGLDPEFCVQVKLAQPGGRISYQLRVYGTDQAAAQARERSGDNSIGFPSSIEEDSIDAREPAVSGPSRP